MIDNNADVRSFCLSEADKQYLRQIVHNSITSYFEGEHSLNEDNILKPENPLLEEHLGAFVTLTQNGSLRGCIGNVVGNDALYRTVARMARAAAFEDPRFPPVSEEEFAEISVEISIMGPLTLCPDTDSIEVGTHGLIMQYGQYSGLLLPQVAKEWQWDKITFLEQTCLKAGLQPHMWKHEDTKIYWFEAYVL